MRLQIFEEAPHILSAVDASGASEQVVSTLVPCVLQLFTSRHAPVKVLHRILRAAWSRTDPARMELAMSALHLHVL